MDIERVNSVLVKAIMGMQESELESLAMVEWPKKGERKRKGKGLIKKIMGRAPDETNPLDRGAGLKGMIGRARTPM